MQALSKQITVGVIGAGAMGSGIAQVAAAYGHPVKLYDVRVEAIAAAIEQLASGLARQVKREKISQADADALIARIQVASSLDDLADAGLIIEAAVENLQIKQDIFASLESLCSSEAIFASNTSSLSITSLAAKLEHPERMVGMHFFNPPQAMKLVEVIDGLATDNEITEALIATADAWGKRPVRTASTPGFIVNRVARPFYAEALRLLQDGAADCQTIDEALSGSGGFRMGPFTLMDLIGLDVNYAVTESVFNAYYQDSRFKPSLIQRELVGGGFLGRKTGRGFYKYSNDAAISGAPAVTPLQAAPAPESVTVVGRPVCADELIAACEQSGITVKREASEQGAWLQVADTRFAFTDGRTATERGLEQGFDNWALVDLMNGFDARSSIIVTHSDRCQADVLNPLAGLLQALGKQVINVDDTPGMIVMRTVCMLVNEASDAVKEGVCDPDAVDTGMQLGTNYPRGPLAWGESIGLGQVLSVVDNLHRWYGEDRYRASVLLRRLVLSGGVFHG